MGQAEYAETLTKDVSGWLKEGADWATEVVQSSGQSMGGMGALDWFAKNWIFLLVTLIVIGLVVDWLVWMVRWRPYRLWFGGRKRPEARMRERFEDEDELEAYRPRRPRRPHFEGSALKQAQEEDPFEDDFELDEVEEDFESDDAFEPEPEDEFEDFDEFEEEQSEADHSLSKPVISKPKLGLFARKNAKPAQNPDDGDEFEDFEDFEDFDGVQEDGAHGRAAASDDAEDDLFDFEDDFADDLAGDEENESGPVQAQGPQVQAYQGAEAWHTGYTTSIPVVGNQQDGPVRSRKERRMRQQ